MLLFHEIIAYLTIQYNSTKHSEPSFIFAMRIWIITALTSVGYPVWRVCAINCVRFGGWIELCVVSRRRRHKTRLALCRPSELYANMRYAKYHPANIILCVRACEFRRTTAKPNSTKTTNTKKPHTTFAIRVWNLCDSLLVTWIVVCVCVFVCACACHK